MFVSNVQRRPSQRDPKLTPHMNPTIHIRHTDGNHHMGCVGRRASCCLPLPYPGECYHTSMPSVGRNAVSQGADGVCRHLLSRVCKIFAESE
jgi:hypothetical protein